MVAFRAGDVPAIQLKHAVVVPALVSNVPEAASLERVRGANQAPKRAFGDVDLEVADAPGLVIGVLVDVGLHDDL